MILGILRIIWGFFASENVTRFARRNASMAFAPRPTHAYVILTTSETLAVFVFQPAQLAVVMVFAVTTHACVKMAFLLNHMESFALQDVLTAAWMETAPLPKNVLATKDFPLQLLENANLSAAKVVKMETVLPQKFAPVEKASRKLMEFVSRSVRGKQKIIMQLRHVLSSLSIPRGCLNGICVAPEQCQCPSNGWSLDSTGSQCTASCDKACLNGLCSG